jgi:predicted RNase H-like nuclease
MARPEIRQNLFSKPQRDHWRDFRLSDYLLRQHNIHIPQTPSDENNCSGWMKMGFLLYRRLAKMGFQLYPSESEHQYLEVYPNASFTSLLGVVPFAKNSLEGRIQRQLILMDRKLKIPDPMRIFEEITRFRLLQGSLSLEQLYSPEELDSLVAAYTTWLAANHPDQTIALGDADEGQIILPVAELREKY